MIKNIIYVEDGSVDVDELKSVLDNDTQVIIYRQGSAIPVLIQPDKPIRVQADAEYAKLAKKAKELQEDAEYIAKGSYYNKVSFIPDIIDFLEEIKREFGPADEEVR